MSAHGPEVKHVTHVQPTAKMDTPHGLHVAVCTCGWRGGPDSERGARVAGEQHAAARNRPLRDDDYGQGAADA